MKKIAVIEILIFIALRESHFTKHRPKQKSALICKIKYLKTISNEPTQQKQPLKVNHLNQILPSTLQRI